MNASIKPGRARGSALVLTLLMVGLLAILLVASFTNMDLSSQLSRSRVDAYSASQYARAGVEQAVGLLRHATEGADVFWVTQPGQITRFELGTPGEGEKIVLSSGAAIEPEGVNLNQPFLQNPTEGSISSNTADKMRLKWIYVRADGTFDASGAYQAENRVVGRYAFWVDDDNAKVNINTAGSGQNVNPASPESQVSLAMALPGVPQDIINDILAFRANKGYFNSSGDILRSTTGEASDLERSVREGRFWLTHFNASSDLTYFNEPRFVLTTRRERATAPDGTVRPFFDIYPDNDWGGVISFAKVDALATQLVKYMSRSDWPMAPGKTFQEKYCNGDPDKLKQIALNIIEYVRLKEVPPANPASPATNEWLTNGVRTSDDRYRGLTRSLCVTEAGAWVNPWDTGTVGTTCWVELYLPKDIGVPEIDLTTLYQYDLRPWGDYGDLPLKPLTVADCYSNTGSGPVNIVKAGEYALIRMDGYVWEDFITASPSHLIRHIRLYTRKWPESDRPTISVPAMARSSDFQQDFYVPYVKGGAGLPNEPTSVPTVSLDDPALGSRRANWHLGANTLGGANPISTMGKNPATPSLEQDLDASGHLTDDGMVLPAPAGVVIPGSPSSNPNGIIESLAELGYIHTGMQGEGLAPSSTPSPDVPWRTLRLQPRHPSAPSDTLPDWALLDLFTLPYQPSTNRLLAPSASTRGGLVNANGIIKPFSEIVRTEALRAVFGKIAGKEEVASHLTKLQLANGSYGKGRTYGTDNPLYFPGQIVEYDEVAADGEVSERSLHGVLDALTTRGSTFTVFSIGQSVVQPPSGAIKVRSEARQRLQVERYEENGGVKFRVISSSALGL